MTAFRANIDVYNRYFHKAVVTICIDYKNKGYSCMKGRGQLRVELPPTLSPSTDVASYTLDIFLYELQVLSW
jgi:hypothetical protein